VRRSIFERERERGVMVSKGRKRERKRSG